MRPAVRQPGLAPASPDTPGQTSSSRSPDGPASSREHESRLTASGSKSQRCAERPARWAAPSSRGKERHRDLTDAALLVGRITRATIGRPLLANSHSGGHRSTAMKIGVAWSAMSCSHPITRSTEAEGPDHSGLALYLLPSSSVASWGGSAFVTRNTERAGGTASAPDVTGECGHLPSPGCSCIGVTSGCEYMARSDRRRRRRAASSNMRLCKRPAPEEQWSATPCTISRTRFHRVPGPPCRTGTDVSDRDSHTSVAASADHRVQRALVRGWFRSGQATVLTYLSSGR